MSVKVRWLDSPQAHDFDAALEYLELIFTAEDARRMVDALKAEEVVMLKTKNVLRAANLPLLPADDRDVVATLKQIMAQEEISPVLLARAPDLGRLILADGYHRICACFMLGDSTEVHARLV